LTTLKQIFPILLLTIASLAWTTPALPTGRDVAQDPTPTPTVTPSPLPGASPQPSSGPIYVVQSGDSLYNIANDFGVSLADLIAANSIVNANNIAVGSQLIIPGLEGINGILDKESISYGDTLRSISRRDQIPEDLLRQLNHITSPSELYADGKLTALQNNSLTPLSSRLSLEPAGTLLEAAVLAQTDPWTLTTVNNLKGTWAAIPGDILYVPGQTPQGSPQPNGMPLVFENAAIPHLPLKQGGTAEIVVQVASGVKLEGTLVDRPLHFFPLEDGKQVALQGIHALLDPGLYPLTLEATLPDGSKQNFEQMVAVQSGNFPTDPVLSVEPETIDPVVNDAEQKKLEEITAPITATKYWQAGFTNPSSFPDCHPSYFGNRRNYIGTGTNQTYFSFHAGLDFCGKVGDPISAAADGVVVFAGLLTVHGNATIIDHGWGIYSMYCHQSQINVQVGQTVKAGDLIGLVGATGRVTAPHLHFEIWVNGIEVDPMDWLKNSYP
jgi:murein DD-endopeptidase MepM/ murein hydrolase activator NlpD